jgi:hypothetical protein
MRKGIPTNVLLKNAALLATNFKTNIEMHLYQRLYKGVKALEGENAQSVFQSILNNKIDHELSLGKNPTFAEKVRLTAKIQEILKDEKKKLFSVIPLVRNNVPHCITLDTVSFFDIFKDECGLLGWKRGNIVQKREELWWYICKFAWNSGKFYFHYRVVTDGIQFNIVYSQKKKKEIKEKGETRKSAQKIVQNLGNGTRVAVDPGKHNIIYCVGFVDGQRKELRYTNVQR